MFSTVSVIIIDIVSVKLKYESVVVLAIKEIPVSPLLRHNLETQLGILAVKAAQIMESKQERL